MGLGGKEGDGRRLAATGRAPFHRIISHGFVVDETGAKMSKSLGNGIEPNSIIKKSGASSGYGIDFLRTWVATSDWTRDASIGSEILKTVGDIQQKIRNTCRFILGNVHDYSDEPRLDHMWLIDKALMDRVNYLNDSVRAAYEGHNLIKVMSLIHHFCTDDLSAFYFDVTKDRLYSEN
ncbi:MAG: class I tRNA ligase family protein, partial [Proteobacteria bacterium]|nr:class I tRNA ligase family protein [Pseudomonadota bacterium]